MCIRDRAIGVSELFLLSGEEAADWSEQVLQASALWQRRAKGVDFYTLGAAHYLDLNPQQTTDHYQALVHRYNPSLWQRFEPLYQKLALFCADYFGGSFSFHQNLALPGFHVFGPKPSAPDSFLMRSISVKEERFMLTRCLSNCHHCWAFPGGNWLHQCIH